MIELLFIFILGTASPAPFEPEVYRCVVRESTTKECVLWYDPETNRYFDRYGNEQPAPW